MNFNGKTMSAFFAGYAYNPKEVIEETAKKTAEEIASQSFAPCIVESASGSHIVLADSANCKLQGLTLKGKNLLNLDWNKFNINYCGSSTLVEKLENGVILQGNNGDGTGKGFASNGGFASNWCGTTALTTGTVTVSFDYTMLEYAYGSTTDIAVLLRGTESLESAVYGVQVGVKKRLSKQFTIKTSGDYYLWLSLNSGKVRIENIQISYSTDTTYVPYFSGGDVTVKVMGKNIADVRKFCALSDIEDPSASGTLSNLFGTTISTNVGDSVTVTQSKYSDSNNPTSYENGYFVVGFYSPLKVGDKIGISFNFKATSNPLDTDELLLFLNNVVDGVIYAKDENTGLYQAVITVQRTPSGDWHNLEIRNAGKSGVFSNFQIEYGTTATDYEPYKEPQTLVVSVPNGIGTDGFVCDCAELHTYKPNTTITNDVGVNMELKYVADTKTYIDNKFAELQNAILSSGANI